MAHGVYGVDVIGGESLMISFWKWTVEKMSLIQYLFVWSSVIIGIVLVLVWVLVI